MTNAEINALAHKILAESAEHIHKIAPQVCRTLVTQSGELYLEFYGTSKLGHGSFRCLYFPLEPIKNLILKSIDLVDHLPITLIDRQTGEVSAVPLSEFAPKLRKRAIKFSSRLAGLVLVGSFLPRLTELLEDEFTDHGMIVTAVLGEFIASLESDEFIHESPTSMQEYISEAVASIAKRKRRVLRDKLSALPNIIAERGRGAPAKTPSQRERERREYIAKVQSVYRDLFTKFGAKPKKTLVAKTLGEGGVNPRTGGSSSLQAFRLKLARLNISYDDITRSLDDETKQ